jgi:hypothetical protein
MNIWKNTLPLTKCKIFLSLKIENIHPIYSAMQLFTFFVDFLQGCYVSLKYVECIIMIEPVKHTTSTPVITQHKKMSSVYADTRNDILAPMKRFKKELPVPQLGQQPNLSLEKIRVRQKEFYSHRGQVYEKLQNTSAAIASYQKASYYEPSDSNIYSQIKRLKIQSLANLKA